jgi:metallopeptidase MepB
VPLFKEAIVLRHEHATLQGYPNHASYVLKDTILGNSEAVRTLLARYKVQFDRNANFESIHEAKRTDEQADDKTLYLWDEYYYKRIVAIGGKEADVTDIRQVRDYFPFQSTIKAMFAMFGELFGIVFENVDGEVWHENVELYSIWDGEDSGGAFLGFLYLDCFSRPGKSPGCTYCLCVCL